MSNLNSLVPLASVDPEKIKAIFKKDSNFAWNIRHWVEEGEADYIQDILKCFDGAHVDWEFGLYTRTTFTVEHDIDTIVRFAAGCIKAQRDFEFFDKKQMSLVEALGFFCLHYRDNEDETKDDELLDQIYMAADAVASEIRDNIKKVFEHWECDKNILDERLSDFIDCYGEDIYLDPTNDKLVEVSQLRMWD